uniref:Variant surface glycoprotein 1125.4074 n=1 Tax=Trypanosoma brucei TaxID=5691 RepID=A0A1J0R9P3_9TRYP|nr:variant surface glycoprotein 1125.4074 [Trypanosoma brucei]
MAAAKGRTIPLLVTLALLNDALTALANVAEDCNQPERRALCAIIELGGERSKLLDQAPGGTSDLDELLSLNMTLAEDTWLQHFRDATDPTKPRDTTKQPLPPNTNWDKRWPDWKKAADPLLTEGKITEKRKHFKLDKLNDEQKHAVRKHVAKLAEEAYRETKRSEEDHPVADFLTEADLHKELNTAIYGAQTEPAGDFTGFQTFGGTAASTRQANCGTSNAAGKATTAFAAFVYVCGKDNTNGGNEAKACAGSVTLNNAWNPGTTRNPTAATLAELRKLCNMQAETTLTASELQRRIADVTGLLRHTQSATHLGTFLATGCSGAANAGVCVTYTGVHNNAADPKKAINWIAQLDATAKKIHKHEHVVQARKRLAQRLAVKKQLATDVDYLTRTIETPQRSPGLQEQAEEQKTKNQAIAQSICDQHKSNKTQCESTDKCKWKGKSETDSPCEVDESKVATQTNAAGTGETANTKAKKCSEKKAKAECKDGCKLDGKECKDSSILANKQFAMMVSAFVCLVELYAF